MPSLVAEGLQVDVLRIAEVAQLASKVAVIGEVRKALVDFQRSLLPAGHEAPLKPA